MSSFGAYKAWLAGMMRQAPIKADADVLDIAGRHGRRDVHRGAREAPAPHPVHRPGERRCLDVARAHYADGAADGVPVGLRGGGRAGHPLCRRVVRHRDHGRTASVTCPIGRARSPRCSACSSPAGRSCAWSSPRRRTPCGRALYNFYLKHLIPFWGGLITGDREGFVYLARSIKALPRPAGPGRPDARRRVRRCGLEELYRRHRRRPRGKETRGSVAANSSPPLPCSAAAEAAPYRAWRHLPRARAHQVAPAPDGVRHQVVGSTSRRRQAYSTRSMR